MEAVVTPVVADGLREESLRVREQRGGKKGGQLELKGERTTRRRDVDLHAVEVLISKSLQSV